MNATQFILNSIRLNSVLFMNSINLTIVDSHGSTYNKKPFLTIFLLVSMELSFIIYNGYNNISF